METEILQHRINYWLEGDNVEIDEVDREHIAYQITEGYSEGELNHGQKEMRGWWKIIK